MRRRRSKRVRIDGRALFALLCAVFAAPLSANPFYPLLFGPVGSIIAIASVVATDAPVSQRTRGVALVAGVLCVAFSIVALAGVLTTHPQSGE